MGWDNTGRNITRKCPKCKGKLVQLEGFHIEIGGGGYFCYVCLKCNSHFETKSVFSIKCRGKLKYIGGEKENRDELVDMLEKKIKQDGRKHNR